MSSGEQRRHDDGPIATRPRKSLKSKPGAMKKREKVVRAERERFERNLAGMLTLNEEHGTRVDAEVEVRGNVMGRWKALRAHLERGREGGGTKDQG